MQKIIHDEAETVALAEQLAPLLKPQDTVVFQGDLGAGKTAFCRALISAMAGSPQEVPSPTFTLVQTYDLPAGIISHFDLYRLEDEERDILELGWDDARRDGICLVEWAERLGGLLPHDRLEIKLEFQQGSDTARRVTITPHGRMVARMEGFNG
jgi:tRNA threonylcarbamoyladenosine biosynthesis protein TsaE